VNRPGSTTYYAGKRAYQYNTTWRKFSERTLAAAFGAINREKLQKIATGQQRPLRILDVACGSGLLLAQLACSFPGAELYGIDASNDMLAQTRQLLQGTTNIHLFQVTVGEGETAGLPFEEAFFDLITCTNMLHYLTEPIAVLQRLRRLLTPNGQIVLEDFSRRRFPWPLFEWLIHKIDAQHVRAYTLFEVQSFCAQARLHVVSVRSFPVDMLWHGWVVRAEK
jgi:ubiquinone/menaquinone biosynthesis C-methylase UbiE